MQRKSNWQLKSRKRRTRLTRFGRSAITNCALIEISRLRPAVDRFFDKVMVMVEDEGIRANRLALLQTLLKKFSTIADFSEIVTEGKESKESSKH